MKAIVRTKYGSPDVMELREIEKPVPKAGELLLKVHAASVNAFDWHILRADPFLVRLMGEGVLRPKRTILGGDVAGVVEAVGEGVTDFKPADEVFGDTTHRFRGSFAEYVAVRQDLVVHKPANVSMEAAAATPLAAVTALQGLRDHGKIEAGEKVLINGASGGVGTFAVQIAKAFDTEVTAVCSTRNLESARGIGADHVIDYTKEDFTTAGKQYDLILAAFGNRSVRDYALALKPDGVLVVAGGTMSQLFKFMLFSPLLSRRSDKKFEGYVMKPNRADLLAMKDLLESGKVRPVIERHYPLEEVPAAMRYVEEGHARGKVVVNVR